VSTLHERLVAEIDRLGRHLVGCVSCTTCEASALTRALRAVVALHEVKPHKYPLCQACVRQG
jgi:hypothetical protein